MSNDEARRMHWNAVAGSHQRGMQSAMDDLTDELIRARRLTAPDASEPHRDLITTSAARLTVAAAKFAEHAYALDAMRAIYLVAFPAGEQADAPAGPVLHETATTTYCPRCGKDHGSQDYVDQLNARMED